MALTLWALGLAASLARASGETDGRDLVRLDMGSRSWLGVEVADVKKEEVSRLKIPEERGAKIVRVEEASPADRAGLQVHDVLWRFRGEPLHGVVQLRRLVEETPPGREVEIEFYRGGSLQKARLALEEKPGEFDFRLSLPREIHRLDRFPLLSRPRLGVSVVPLTEQLAEHLGAESGLLVTEVQPGSAAERAGIKAGDVLRRADGRNIEAVEDLHSALAGRSEVSLDLVRDKKPLSLTVQLEARRDGRKL